MEPTRAPLSDGTHASTVNCISDQVAREMAAGVCKLFGTDVGLSITGYAEGETYAWLGFNVQGKTWEVRVEGTDSPWLSKQERRTSTQDEYAQVAVEHLLQSLQSHPV